MERDLLYVITSKLSILVAHSGQIPAEAISTIVIILNLTAIVCHLGGPFSVVFPNNKTIIVTRPILSDSIGLTILRPSRLVKLPVLQRLY